MANTRLVRYRPRRREPARAPGEIFQMEHSYLDMTPRTGSCAIANIPPEILLTIMDHLPMPFRLSLALTCKGFYNTFRILTSSKPDEMETSSMLYILQRDIPNVYFCFRCHKLCPLNQDRNWEGQNDHGCGKSGLFGDWDLVHKHIPKQQIPLLWHPVLKEAHLDFMEAYLVMDSHFYGESHGLPLSTLERHSKFEKFIILNRTTINDRDDWNDDLRKSLKVSKACKQTVFDVRPQGSKAKAFQAPWRFSFDSIPKIIDNELYIARTHTVEGPMVGWEHLARLLESIHLPICRHLRCITETYSYCHIIISRSHNNRSICQKDWNHDHHFQQSGSCQYCYTDYDISLQRDNDKKEWRLKICTYHYLGACRSPADLLWDYLVRDVCGPLNPLYWEMKHRHLDMDLGKARRRWHEGDEGDSS
ncbi:f-box domain-containing protein [Trichoderma breve]|uniref:F-box domain-containing protein n=1 Tax=Trichoderma breve TaxID=2034170 RepID=A0A9W9E2V1_9HYPO|nr:f-box domain-containing protein [Trichoderma breve]KAJ4854840.1 f-box domain-containing protein [Trichoderma breve]